MSLKHEPFSELLLLRRAVVTDALHADQFAAIGAWEKQNGPSEQFWSLPEAVHPNDSGVNLIHF